MADSGRRPNDSTPNGSRDPNLPADDTSHPAPPDQSVSDQEILTDLKDQIRSHQEQLLKIRNETKTKNKDLRELEAKIAGIKTSYDKISKDSTAAKRQLQETEQKHKVLSNELNKLQETHDLNRNLQKIVSSQSQKLDKNKKDIAELSTKCLQNEREIKTKTEKLAEVALQLQTKTEQHNHYTSQMDIALKGIKEKMQKQQNDIDSKNSTIETLQTEVAMLQGCVVQFQDEGQRLNIELETERFEHNQTRENLELCMNDIGQKNISLQANEKEIQFLQDAVNKAKIEARELQLKYLELPEKERQFERIESKNKELWDENVDLQERIKEIHRLNTLITSLRERNESLSHDKERLEVCNRSNADKYREQVCHYGQQTDELRMIKTELVKYKKRTQQNTNEIDALKRSLQEAYDNVEELKQDLVISQSELMNARSQLARYSERDSGGP